MIVRMPYDFPGDGEDGAPAVINLPSAEGTFLGRQLARLTDVEEPRYRERNPGAHRRCGECAFRRGTFPNRCLSTVATALKCAIEGEEFLCHTNVPNGTEPNGICAGWAILSSAIPMSRDDREELLQAIPLPPIERTS